MCQIAPSSTSCSFCLGPKRMMENRHGRRSSFYWACIGCNRTWNLRDDKLNPGWLCGTIGPTPRHAALQHLILNLGFSREEALEFVNEFGYEVIMRMAA